MKRLLIASIAIACGASLALSASPEVDKAIKTIQGVAADPAKMQLFCALDQASDTEGQANPEQEKQAEEILGKLGASSWRPRTIPSSPSSRATSSSPSRSRSICSATSCCAIS